MHVKPARKEYAELLGRSPALIASSLQKMAAAILKKDIDLERRRTAAFAQLLGETMALADLLGRRRTLLEFDAHARKPQPARFGTRIRGTDTDRVAETLTLAVPGFTRFGATPLSPDDSFREAFDDLVSREPRLAKNSEEVRKAYAEHGFALAKLPQELSEKARMALTRRIQKMLAGYVQTGTTEKIAREQLSEIGGFSQGYASTVYRTNLNTAYTAGRMKQLKDPDVREVIPAFEFDAIRDSSVRPNHLAADGFIADVDHVEWNRIAPPLAWNCRCSLRSITRGELKSRGLLLKGGHVKPYYPKNFVNAYPDPGFKHTRPDF